jgi:hypothetical protein
MLAIALSARYAGAGFSASNRTRRYESTIPTIGFSAYNDRHASGTTETG